VIEAELKAGSRLTLTRLQEHSAERVQTSLTRAQVGRNASLTANIVDLGGQLVRNDFDIQLNEPGASVELLGVFLASAGQHVDNHLCVEHRAPAPFLMGRHLLDLGLSPGPSVGELLHQVYERQLDGEIQSLEDAIALARTIVRG